MTAQDDMLSKDAVVDLQSLTEKTRRSVKVGSVLATVCDLGPTLEPTLAGRLAFTYTGMPMLYEAWQTHAHAVAIQVMVQTINFYCNTSHIIISSRAIQLKFLSCDCSPLSLTTEWASRTPMREWTWNNSGLLTQPSRITVSVSTICLTIACIRRRGCHTVTICQVDPLTLSPLP